MNERRQGSVMEDKKKILLVDDDESVRDACMELLRVSGFDVDPAKDGFEAFRRLEEAEYDLIIADINMPQVDGIDFYFRVVRNFPDMKDRFVFMTGDIYGEQEALSLYLKSDRTVLKKPFTKDVFLKAVLDVLGRQR